MTYYEGCLSDDPLCRNHPHTRGQSHDREGRMFDICSADEEANARIKICERSCDVDRPDCGDHEPHTCTHVHEVAA